MYLIWHLARQTLHPSTSPIVATCKILWHLLYMPPAYLTAILAKYEYR